MSYNPKKLKKAEIFIPLFICLLLLLIFAIVEIYNFGDSVQLARALGAVFLISVIVATVVKKRQK